MLAFLLFPWRKLIHIILLLHYIIIQYQKYCLFLKDNKSLIFKDNLNSRDSYCADRWLYMAVSTSHPYEIHFSRQLKRSNISAPKGKTKTWIGKTEQRAKVSQSTH